MLDTRVGGKFWKGFIFKDLSSIDEGLLMQMVADRSGQAEFVEGVGAVAVDGG